MNFIELVAQQGKDVQSPSVLQAAAGDSPP